MSIQDEVTQRTPLLQYIKHDSFGLTGKPSVNAISTPYGDAVYRKLTVNAQVSALTVEDSVIPTLHNVRNSLFMMVADKLMGVCKTPVSAGRLPYKWASPDCVALLTQDTHYQHLTNSHYTYSQEPTSASLTWEGLQVHTHAHKHDIILDCNKSRVINIRFLVKTKYLPHDVYALSLSVEGYWLIICDASGNDQPAQWQNAALSLPN